MLSIPPGAGWMPHATSGVIQQTRGTSLSLRQKGGQNQLTLRTPQLRWQHCKAFIAFCSFSWAQDLSPAERGTWSSYPALGLSPFGRFMLSNKVRQQDVFPFGANTAPTLAYRTQPALFPTVTDLNNISVSALAPGSGPAAFVVTASSFAPTNEAFHTIAVGHSRAVRRFTYPSGLHHIEVLHLTNVIPGPPGTDIQLGVDVTNVIGPLQLSDAVTFASFRGGVTDNWLDLSSLIYSPATSVPFP